MERQPLVSVIMPAYNAGKYIEEAIRSVIAQTVTDWELLVIDDCSTDETCAIVAKLAEQDERIRLFRNEENRGVARTRNRGLDLCRGQYVALLDRDDLWLPEKLAKQLQQLRDTGAELGYCSYAMIDKNGCSIRADYLVPEAATYEWILRENVIGCSTAIMTQHVAKRNKFSTDFYHEDYVMWLSLLKEGIRACGCQEVLAKYRVTSDSRSGDKLRSAKNRWKILRVYLELPLWKSCKVFIQYALTAVAKYR